MRPLFIMVLSLVHTGQAGCGPSCSCSQQQFPPMSGLVCWPNHGGDTPCCPDAGIEKQLCIDNATRAGWPMCSSKMGLKICPHNTGDCTIASSTDAPSSATRPLTMLTHPKARCMDGTLSGFYYHPSPLGSIQDKWVLNLQGGGECVSAKCATKVKSALGSSKYFPKEWQFWDESKVHFSDTSCVGNPELCEYHQVYLPYCSQDLWTGRANSTSHASEPAPGYYFSGHLILQAVLDELDSKHNLSQASTIILSGESAGGFGVYHNVDYVAERYPKAEVVGAPIAGYEFYAWPYDGPGHTSSNLADFRATAMASGAYNKLWSSGAFNSGCLTAHSSDPGACLLPCFSYTFVKARLFIIEAQADSVVLAYHNWLPWLDGKQSLTPTVEKYMQHFAANQTRCLSSALAPNSQNGVFNPSCYIHTEFDNTYTLDDGNGKQVGYLEAFRHWMKGASVKLSDRCADDQVVCNPTCPLGGK